MKKAKRMAREKWNAAERYTLEVSGFNQTRLINAFVAAEIGVENIVRESAQKMLLNIKEKDSKKGFAILDEMCYTYRVAKKFGIRTAFCAWLTRSAAIISLLVFGAMLLLSRGYIWRVEIDGNQKVADSVVVASLLEHGVAVGKAKKSVDKIAVKNAINGLGNVLNCEVNFIGTTAKVSIIETTFATQPPIAQTTDICAKYDAEITRIEARQGTAKAHVGDRIFAGGVIISASRQSSDGESVLPSLAEGRAYGKVSMTFSSPIYAEENKLVATGKTYSSTVLSLFGWSVGKVKNPFERYSSARETLNAFEGNLLPIKVTREKFTELEFVTEQVDCEARAIELEREIVTENVLRFGGEKIVSSRSLRKLSDKCFALDVFIQAEMIIT